MKRFFLLFLLISCQGMQVSTKQIAKPPEIFTGTSALEVSFLPSQDLLMCQESTIPVKVENKGAFDASGSFVFISDQYLAPIEGKSGKVELKGKSVFNPVGDYTQFYLKVKNNGLPKQLEKYSANVVFQACYPYQTVADVTVCIDPDVENRIPNKPCNANIVLLSGGQGAPVEIVSVEPLMVSSRNGISPMFKIMLKHSGNGQIIPLGSVGSACKTDSKTEFGSFVVPEVSLPGKIVLTCNPSPFRIDAVGDSYFICSTNEEFVSGSGTFLTSLSIKLKYGYISTKVLPININRLKGQKSCS